MISDFLPNGHCASCLRFSAVTALLLYGMACAPVDGLRGYVPEGQGSDEQLAEEGLLPLYDMIKAANLTTREQVMETFGTPSTKSILGNTWYYASTHVQEFMFYRPEIIDQEVVAVSFNQNGGVTSIKQYTLADGYSVTPVERITKTGGQELTIVEQFLGNLGRFDTPPQVLP
ncbi:MAG: outer membrane protein assembly factor BamE [Parvularculales bacterium]